MKSNLFARCFAVMLLIAGLVWVMSSSSSAQSGRRRQPPTSPKYETQDQKSSEKEPEKSSDKPMADNTPVEVDENGTIKMDTSLVNIPVSVIDRDGKFVPFLTKRDFRLYEDGVEQRIEAFDSIETPFYVALVLDTSNSTMFKMDEIQDAAVAFIRQLRRDDQVMVVSFDSRVRFHCDFTTDQDVMREAISETRTGGSTKLYEAVDKVVDRLEQIQGRKAIVLFTDGVDTSSRRANYQNTIEKVEESGALVYPIKYDTEDFQQGGVINGPNNNPWPWPTPSPSPRGRRRWPFNQFVTPQFPQWPRGRTQWPGGGGSSGDYRRGARYLQELADRSGGRLYDADSTYNLSQAFTMIAEELRHQYALSYYPTNSKKDGAYRRVKVRVEKPELVVRAREGYRAAGDATTGNQNDRPELKRRQLAAQ
ncbi:MAG: VWA domain-containing protein [Blastocatellales bacterium]